MTHRQLNGYWPFLPTQFNQDKQCSLFTCTGAHWGSSGKCPPTFNVFIYIIDLPSNIKSTIRVYTNGCALYRNIQSLSDHEDFQTDLKKISESKCRLITVTNKKITLSFQCLILNKDILCASSHKYLGVHSHYNLSWQMHIQRTISDLFEELVGFLKRNIIPAPTTTKLIA